MKKIILVFLIIVFLINGLYVYSDYEDYNEKLKIEILDNINNKIIPNLTKSKNLSKDELLLKIKEKLENLKKSYNKGDFEIDVIDEVIKNLELEENKQKQEENKLEQKQETEKGDKQEEPQIVKNGSMGLGGDETSIQKLTPDEAKELEEYYQSLKNDEKQNQEFFNKKNNSKKEESPFDQFMSPFRFFEGDPFFDEIGGDDNKKDW